MLVGIVDYGTGVQISFAVFYTIPVALVSWFVGLRYGLIISMLCSLEWLLSDLKATYTQPFIPFWNASMRLTIFILITVILSKLKIALELERKAREAANQASRIKSEFLANMSHEIRTPMNSIIAMSDLLSESPSPVEFKKYAHILKNEGNHLLKLINDILDLSKVEAGLFEFQKTNFDLHQLVEHLASFMAVRAREKGLTISYRIMSDVPSRIVGDEECLRRILINLLGNSIKFTETGEIRLQVENDPAHPKAGSIRVSVSDTGIGIPPEKTDAIFERFTTIDPSLARKHGGTGLGLNISRKLVEGMGGRIWAESRLGQGSTFYFSIPFGIQTNPIEKTADPALDVADLISSISEDQRPLRILLAEDYKSNQVIIQSFLRKTQYQLDIVEDGAAAVLKFKSGTYDLVLMDVQMPGMDGYTATTAIREWEQERGLNPTPILALTAHALKDEAERSLKVGCNAHLTKPITKFTLFKNIYECTKSWQPYPEKPGRRETDQKPPVRVDPDISPLIPDFLEEMRHSCKSVELALDRNDYETVQTAGHQIKGCGGSYGFPAITNFGRSIEDAALKKNGEDIRKQIQEFLNYLEKVEVVCE